MTAYFIHGLVVDVPFALAGSHQIHRENRKADVVVEFGVAPDRLRSPVARGTGWEASPGQFLLDAGGDVGRFFVDGRGRVIYERPDDADVPMASLVLTHPVMAAVLRHRGVLVLHANTVLTDRGAIAVSGISGAGKSTTTAALVAEGCQLVTEDVTVLVPRAGHGVDALVGVAEIHLRTETLSKLQLQVGDESRQSLRNKTIVDVSEQLATGPQTLKELYLLTTADREDVAMVELTGASLFEALQDCIYGPLLPEDTPASFETQVQLARTVRMWRIERPADSWSLREVVAAITR